MHMAGTEASALYAAKNVMQRINDGSMLWDGPDAPDWVACHQRNKTCYCKVPKADWYSPTRRASSCKAVFSEQVKKGLVNSTAVGLDVCNLNGRTNSMCEVLCWLTDSCFFSALLLLPPACMSGLPHIRAKTGAQGSPSQGHAGQLHLCRAVCAAVPWDVLVQQQGLCAGHCFILL